MLFVEIKEGDERGRNAQPEHSGFSKGLDATQSAQQKRSIISIDNCNSNILSIPTACIPTLTNDFRGYSMDVLTGFT